MGNRIVRVIIGIILGIAALVGVYFILPGTIKHPLQEKVQSWLKKDEYEVVTYIKGIKVPGSEMTFGDMIEYAGKHGSWVIEYSDVGEDKKSGSYEVHAYVYDVDLSMAHENGQDNNVNMSQAAIDISFFANRKVGQTPEIVVTSYGVTIDETSQNDFYKKQCLGNLVSKATGNKANAEAEAAKEATTESK